MINHQSQIRGLLFGYVCQNIVMQIVVILICTLLIFVIAGYIIMPIMLLRIVNRKLSNFRGYEARLQRIQISLLRARIIGHDFRLHTITDPRVNKTIVNLHIPMIFTHFSWRELLKGSVLAKVVGRMPSLDIHHHPDPLGASVDEWYIRLQNKLNRTRSFTIQLKLEDSRVTYQNDQIPGENPIVVSCLDATVDNFSNEARLNGKMLVKLNASVFDGVLNGKITLDTLADHPTFFGNLELAEGQLKHLNPFLRKYLRFDVHAGKFSIRSEVNVTEGLFQGYIEPVLFDVQVRGREDREKGFLSKVWEWGVAMAIRGFGKGKQDKVSLRVPLTGSIDTIQVSLAEMIPAIIRKMFHRMIPVFRL